MLNIIGAIVSGLVIGVLARFFYPGTVPMGWLSTILLGTSVVFLVVVRVAGEPAPTR